MFCNLFRDGGALLEEQAAGDQSIPVELDEAAAKCLSAVIEGTASYPLSRACALLFLAGVRHAQRDARRPAVTP
ncbi:MAG TPA: hypothetical protein VD866_17720 [Urbifossiella sp.]|nr:hypothetical protein [Urbifossiella sp.]